jgi:hypothetical protein
MAKKKKQAGPIIRFHKFEKNVCSTFTLVGDGLVQFFGEALNRD